MPGPPAWENKMDDRSELKDIKKSYGKKEVLRGVSLPLERGQSIALAGANGSGKSTLLRLLAGVIPSGGGEFWWQGSDLLRDRALARRAVAYVPQGTPLIDELTAWDNLRLWYDRDALERSLQEGMLRQLGVGSFLKTAAGKLSGGMRKRLSIGCAMSGQPEILLLDEPTAALDLPCKQALLDAFALFRQQGGLILMATHDLLELGSCDRVYLLSGGVLSLYDYDGDPRRLARALETA